MLGCCSVRSRLWGFWGVPSAPLTPGPFPPPQLLYRRVRLRCRGKAALPLLSLDRDGGFGGWSGRSVSKASLYFQLVFLLCWTPGKAGGCPKAPESCRVTLRVSQSHPPALQGHAEGVP